MRGIPSTIYISKSRGLFHINDVVHDGKVVTFVPTEDDGDVNVGIHQCLECLNNPLPGTSKSIPKCKLPTQSFIDVQLIS